MGRKDIAERSFMALDDVFADVFNGLIFGGKQIITPDTLTELRNESQYKADDGMLHEQERDVSKVWEGVRFKACLAGELQTGQDKDAPFRIMSYDGSSYRSQLLRRESRSVNGTARLVKSAVRYPVITLVLYFGEEEWRAPTNLVECFNPRLPEDEITNELKKYISDYRINVFDISRLNPDIVKQFRSDFRLVVDYFINSRNNPNYRPDNVVIKHVDEFLKLMSVLTGDNRYQEISMELSETERKEGIRMCKVLDYREARGEARGLSKGMAQGEAMAIVRFIDNYMRKNSITLMGACEALEISVEEYNSAKALIAVEG